MTPQEIATAMTGVIAPRGPDRAEAFLPSGMIQNHAAFLARLEGGALVCAWFGGTLEGKSDISVHASVLMPGAQVWGPAQMLSHDAARSEQNPVIFTAPDGALWLFHTAQPSGNQDECQIRMARLIRDGAALRAEEGRFLDLPRGCFIRAPLVVRSDGAWLLPIFRCTQRPGQRWNGSHDTAAMGVSRDGGQSWVLEDVAQSTGSVHMTPVAVEGGYVAFYRRRQADFVHRSESADGHVWSAPEPVDIPNNNSSIMAIRLLDGRVAVLGNPISAAMSPDRRASLYDELGGDDTRPDADPEGGCVPVWGVPRAPVTLCLSEDGGRSFPIRLLIEDGPGTCLSNDSIDGRNKEMSYPAMMQDADGTLHIAYTYHRRAIKYVRLAPEWLEKAVTS